MARVAACAAVALWSACVDQTFVQPTARAIIVHAVLDASAPYQDILVQTTTGATFSQKDVLDAEVTVTTPDHRVVRAEPASDTVVRNAAPGAVPLVHAVYRIPLQALGPTLVPGGVYELRVHLVDGRDVRGTTIVPPVPYSPATAFSRTIDRTRDTLNLTWPSVAGVSAYEVFVGSSRSSLYLFADSSVALPGTLELSTGGVVFREGLTHDVVVSAVDANYYDFYRRNSDPFTGTGIVNHLDGAIGVFGSIVPIARGTVVVR